MNDDLTISLILAGDAEVIALVRLWIRAAVTPYRSRLAAEIEDLEQQTLLELTLALREGRFQGRSRLRTYVRNCVHHKCIDRIRALSRREWVDIAELDLPSPTRSVVDELSHAQAVELALQVQEEMSDSCRELYRMIDEGMSYEAMSRRLQIAVGTLRVRVLRCRKRAVEIRERLLEAGFKARTSSGE